MIVFVSFKKLFQTFLWLFTAAALYVFYQFIGLNMFFLLVIGLLALKFVPVLVLPILLIGVGSISQVISRSLLTVSSGAFGDLCHYQSVMLLQELFILQ